MKRIRRYPDRPNPLFEKWLEEWKKEAIERESSLQHSFERALTSLRKYPLPLSSGKDCYILQHFGYKLCCMIDKKLSQYHKLCTVNYNVPSSSTQSSLSPDSCIKNKQKEISENENDELKKEKYKKKIPNKAYVPKIGSSSYAILITMYKNMKEPNTLGFMYKKDIISQAQNECNYSMKKTASEPFSGWSSMSLLIKKHLVIKENKIPSKFILTDAGISLAMSLMEASKKVSSDCSDEEIRLCNVLRSDQNQNKSVIAVPLKSSDSRSKLSEKGSNDLKYLEKSSVYLNSKNELPCSFESLSPLKNLSQPTKDIDIITIDDDNDDVKEVKYNITKTDDERINYLEKVARKMSNVEDAKSNDDSLLHFCKENVESLITEVESEYNIKTKKSDENKARKEKFIKIINTASQNNAGIFAEDTSTEHFYLLPNNFDIILLVDTQEATGSKAKVNNDEKISELRKIGILFEIRSLKIGDFTWIAKCRFTNRELVLPYIVERKRMDDFSSSIKDGRYHEQKFRLQQSGIKNIIYMIESCGKNYHSSIPITSLYQAAMNSLIQDDFTVKFTNDHKHSMRYLATMTTMLTVMYETKELKSCKKNDLPTMNPNILEGSQLLMEFIEFNKAAIKTKNFNVREMFLRQLLQLKGLSVEKASAIVQLYPTPKCLAEALKNADDNLLSNIVTESKKLKIGPSISKTIYQLYTRHNFN